MSHDPVKILKRRAWSAVPDDILQDTRMSLKARAVMAWIIGRPPNWVLYIRYMQHVMGMTEAMWKSIRKELESAGYYKQERVQLATGKIYWEKTFTEEPMQPTPSSPPMGKIIDGETNCEAAAGDFAAGDKAGDIPPIQKQRKLPPPPTSSRKHDVSDSTPESVVVDIEDLIEAAYWQAMKADKLITNPSAWRASVRKRLQENGPSAEDQFCLNEWRAFLKARERRQVEDAEKAAKEAQPVADREVAMAHLRDLKRPFGRSISSQETLDNGETTANQPQDDGGMPS